MNREIKFRAWDPDKKLMSPVWNIGFKAWDWPKAEINEIMLEDEYGDGTYNADYPHRIILMQFTGLIDIKGKDIYEGDILEYETYDKQKRIVKVIYQDGGFKSLFVYEEQFKELYQCKINKLGLEIIGNIYENAE